MSDYLFKDREVTVRKPHNCCWCAQRISKGEQAQYRTYLWEGGLRSDWMHPECYEAMSELDDDDRALGWTEGDFVRGSTESA